jgi:hypothetical protein
MPARQAALQAPVQEQEVNLKVQTEKETQNKIRNREEVR